MRLIPGDEVIVYQGKAGDTYENALLSFAINPDTVLIFYRGQSIPQDSELKEEMVEIVSTCSRG
ncbi:MAG: thiamine S protein [Methanoregulaceae archaeon]|jgi:sulfur carrier protein ThiS|nr:thiamine S protein [Methanoregulaceae archaeon]